MKLPLLASSFLITLGTAAQPVFTAADFTPPMGPTATIHSTDHIPPGPATAGFVHDVSSAVPGAGTQSQVMAASATPYYSYFPQATIATTGLTNQTTYAYFTVSASEFLNWGYYATASQSIYTNPEKLYQFPMSYGTTWSDNFAGTVTASGFTINRTGSITGTYNGHGTLIMPYGTFNNIARIQLTQNYNDEVLGTSSASQVITVAYVKQGVPTSLFSSSDTYVDQGSGLELFQSTSTIIAASAVGIMETEAGRINALLFPNPASDQLSITLSEPAPADLQVNIIDAAGRTIRVISGPEVARNEVITLDVSGLDRGAYFVRLLDRNGANCTMPLIVE